MRRSVSTTMGIRLLCTLLFAKTAFAEKDSEFAFDLFSDIAPILALFGEQFARQFTSESLTWLDHVIFALVPLGIVTVITGAIRVQGSRIARSFIGRARENRAQVELELMSSTSGEVCELFNGKGIVRVMGKPKIAQFLIFPKLYDQLENELKADRHGKDETRGIHSFQSAVTEKAHGQDTPLMRYIKFRSFTHRTIASWGTWLFMRIRALWRQQKLLCRASEDEESNPQAEPFRNPEDNFEWLGPPNLQLGLSSDYLETGLWKQRYERPLAATAAIALQLILITIAAVVVFHSYTRSLLDFKPKVYSFPCYAGGSLLLSAGIGICSWAVERNTVEYSWRVRRDLKKKQQSKSCKLLSPSKTDGSLPRLLWLQQNQMVSDQLFEGYAILAGPKQNITTSTRLEDVMKALQKRDNEETLKTRDKHSRSNSETSEMTPMEQLSSLSYKILPGRRAWELLSVGGAFAAGAGFIAQFMGLRGLPYPCSVAQVIAMFLMALIRAFIRRRLGRIPKHFSALARYELDFLAILIVFCPDFRTQKIGFAPEYFTDRNFQWQASAPEISKREPFFFEVPKNISLAEPVQARNTGEIEQRHKESLVKRSTATVSKIPLSHSETFVEGIRSLTRKSVITGPEFKSASSEQLVRVRKRLGDLCKWTSPACESALSVAQSVELFMNTFFPEQDQGPHEPRIPQKSPGDTVDWVLETVTPSGWSTSGNIDSVTIPIKRYAGKWVVDSGKLDAIISLWMASIEARLLHEQKASGKNPDAQSGLSDWRRTPTGIGSMNCTFLRILGDDFEDGVLRRDLSWWADEQIADQISSKADTSDRELHDDTTPTPGTDLVCIDSENDYLAHDSLSGWKQSPARGGKVDLVIGCNGRSADVDARRKLSNYRAEELAVISSAYLPTILAQHLFTSFMWTIAESLPKDCLWSGFSSAQNDTEVNYGHDVEVNSQGFDLYKFKETWLRPKLRHRKLSRVVRSMETFGLGSATHILLCMIPALSFRDLLPNHDIVPRLIPQIGPGQGWAETAGFYKNLLETSVRITPEEEKFCYTIVVATMDFIYLACRPYDESNEMPKELGEELRAIVSKLSSKDYARVIKKLAPIYSQQKRAMVFGRIFEQYKASEDSGDCSEIFRKQKDIEDGSLPPEISEFLNYPSIKEKGISTNVERLIAERRKTVDIFGWTSLHYAALSPVSRNDYLNSLETSSGSNHRGFYKRLDKLRRSPLHVAAYTGNFEQLEIMMKFLNKEEKQNALNMPGSDGMTPLHLACTSGSEKCVQYIIEAIANAGSRPLTKTDIWDREAIHIATWLGHDKVANLLLKHGSRIEVTDKFGKSPLDYVLDGVRDLEDKPPDAEDANESSDKKPVPPGRKASVEGRRTILVQIAQKYKAYRTAEGQNILHRAVKSADTGSIKNILAAGYNIDERDSSGQTSLHLAILTRRVSLILSLLNGLQLDDGKVIVAQPELADKKGVTPLMLAASAGLTDVIKVLCGLMQKGDSEDGYKAKLNKQDMDGRTALHYAGQEASHTNALKAIETLMAAKCDQTIRNNEGRTALHVALNQGLDHIASRLLEFEPLQDHPKDDQGESLLITACKEQCSSSIPQIMKKWPNIVNDGDPDLDAPPISWACVSGDQTDIVESLLKNPEVDINRPATKTEDPTPLQIAIKFLHFRIAKVLLDDKRMIDDQRIWYVKEMCKEAWGYYLESDVQQTVLTQLERIKDQSLTANTLVEFINLSETVRDDYELKDAFFQRALQRALSGNMWEEIENPYHFAARMGSHEFVEFLLGKGADPTILDEDGWSCADIAAAFKHGKLCDELVQHIEHHSDGRRSTSQYVLPKDLDVGELERNVSVAGCTNHTDCTGIIGIEVLRAQDERSRACLLSENCVPPPSWKKIFYFEVAILEDSDSRIVGLGFCQKKARPDVMPGWFEGSWAYHGDDGKLFLESGHPGISPSADFGTKGKYGAGQVVGVGLDLETGEGFCTKDGVKLDMANAFEHRKFNYGKIYPCIGIDTTKEGVGLRLEVNFGSPQHPFRYPGPFS